MATRCITSQATRTRARSVARQLSTSAPRGMWLTRAATRSRRLAESHDPLTVPIHCELPNPSIGQAQSEEGRPQRRPSRCAAEGQFRNTIFLREAPLSLDPMHCDLATPRTDAMTGSHLAPIHAGLDARWGCYQ